MLRRPPDGRHGPRLRNRGLLFFYAVAFFAATCAGIDRAAEAGGVGPERVALHGLEEQFEDASAQAQAQAQVQAGPRENNWEQAAHQATIQHGSQPSHGEKTKSNDQNVNNRVKIPHDASALATLAPAPAVRAPIAKGLRPSIPATGAGLGLSAGQGARDLGDWEVEDFVLLATVDGDIYAADRKTGEQRWHVMNEQAMVETLHHRANATDADEDYMPEDKHIWAIEPTNDGRIYTWAPRKEGPILSDTGLTMKKLVDELAPYASTDPPVAYVGDKKKFIYTFDAARGDILEFIGTSSFQVDEARCAIRNTLADPNTCGKLGTITLGRVEYHVRVQRRDGLPLATLKYSEWTLNSFDNDLGRQYGMPLDQRYITGDHEGSLLAFSPGVGLGIDSEKKLSKLQLKTPSPLAKVFDVCRPRNSEDAKPALVAFPQPPPPPIGVLSRENKTPVVFLNCTEEGNWYALSEPLYPLVARADTAILERPEFFHMRSKLDHLTLDQLSKSLVGTHRLDAVVEEPYYEPPLLPSAGQDSPATLDESANETLPPRIDSNAIAPPEGGYVSVFRSLPQAFVDRLVALATNEMLIFMVVTAMMVYHKELRGWVRRLVTRWNVRVNDAGWFVKSQSPGDDSESETDEKVDQLSSSPVKRQIEAKETPTVEDDAKVTITMTTKDDEEVTQSDKSDKSDQVDNASQMDGLEQPSPPGQASIGSSPDAALDAPKKKKAHRGRRGGVKHRKGGAAKRENSQSNENGSKETQIMEATVNMVKGGFEGPAQDPNRAVEVKTISGDKQSVASPILKIDNIEVNTNEQLGTGSNGTVVFAGKFDGRVVAVKRMLVQFYDIASQETTILRDHDHHPNVIRYYDQKEADGFLYIALERCTASLADVIEKPNVYSRLALEGKKNLPDVLLQITNGLRYLHEKHIVHRDLKPHNILVNMVDGRLRLYVSDFGLCKRLEVDQSSFGATTGRAAGTRGWRAPELLMGEGGGVTPMTATSLNSGSGSVLVNQDMMPNRRATRSIDIFALGLIYYYVLAEGEHAYDCGDSLMREVNIRKGKYCLDKLDVYAELAYEAKDVISMMLSQDPKQRPTAKDIMSHPFFWAPRKCLSFLCETSDFFEREPRDPPSDTLQALESYAPIVMPHLDFLNTLPREFVDGLGRQRKYNTSKMLDLLRALRNKKNHYEDMSDSLKRTVGSLPDGYLLFWRQRFHPLIITCWNVIYEVGASDQDRFQDYYKPHSWSP